MDRASQRGGLARNLRLHYPPWLSYAAVGILLFANVINLAADIAAMGDALASRQGDDRVPGGAGAKFHSASSS